MILAMALPWPGALSISQETFLRIRSLRIEGRNKYLGYIHDSTIHASSLLLHNFHFWETQKLICFSFLVIQKSHQWRQVSSATTGTVFSPKMHTVQFDQTQCIMHPSTTLLDVALRALKCSKTHDLAWSCFCIVHFFTLIHTIIIIIGPSPAFVPTTVLDLWSRDPDQDTRHFVRSNAQHAGIKWSGQCWA